MWLAYEGICNLLSKEVVKNKLFTFFFYWLSLNNALAGACIQDEVETFMLTFVITLILFIANFVVF